MRRRKILWTMGLSGLALLAGALTFGMNAAYGGLAGGYYAYSPILEKFVDNLPGVGFNNRSTTLQTYIPIAQKVTNTLFPNDDYYEIAMTDGFRQKMHSALPSPGTLVRGYIDLGVASPTFGYLGPIIIAQRDKPVRIKMSNMMDTSSGASGGKLQIPTDYLLMGAGAGPSGGNYTQNRASTHLHGGLPPWVSDGTAIQWYTPIGEASPYNVGASFRNVPDMWFLANGTAVVAGTPGATNDPGQGKQTLYYTNQHSSRLLFYHDHAVGITRLNVYAGMAAGYLVVDAAEEALINAGTIPGGTGFPPEYRYGIPLIIQDKTFVPANIDNQDPKWSQWKTTYGINWVVDGVAAASTGDFWFPHIYEPNQNPSDTANLGMNPFGRWDYGPWFWPPLGTVLPMPNATPTVPTENYLSSTTPEAFMDTPIVNGCAYPYLNVDPKAYRFRILNACNDRNLNLQLYQANPNGYLGPGGFPTEVAMVPALDYTVYPLPAPVAGFPVLAYPGPGPWPIDTRVGGVPNWNGAGPSWYQIGTEGGFLPAPAVIPPTPTNYDYDRRSITVLNVLEKCLFLGPAERADVIVDFSGFAGKTIILYNDAPAPVPASDPRCDLYTGNEDQTSSGGAPSTAAGFGPNTRTIMQFRVSNAAPVQFNLANLQNRASGLPKAYADSQPQPIVPQTAYGLPNGPYNQTFTDTYVRIQDNYITYSPMGASAPVTKFLFPKAIQELFDRYGRMNATLGVELPFTNITNQTTIPLGYIDPTTETIGPGETQFWKITHNGVDTHAVHFHLVNLQVINRVGWDGSIRPPDDNEQGWKETVRMNPLEDCIVAVRAIQPQVPFTVSNSVRYLAPSLPPGPSADFTNVDANGNPVTTNNQMTNFGWEYVWHCHLLGHEENDMMRPFVFNPNSIYRLFWRNSGAGGDGTNVFWYLDNTSVVSTTLLPNVGATSGFQVVAATGDFNHDGRPDLIWRNTTTGQNIIWFMQEDTVIGTDALPTVAADWQIAGAGDFNHDSNPDLIWRNPTTGQNVIWFMNGTSIIGTAPLASAGTGWTIGGISDFNQDGNPDLVWRNTTTGQNVVWYMNGTTQIGTDSLPTAATVWNLVAVGDMNYDVNPDLVWRNTTTGENVIWFLSGPAQIGNGVLPTISDQHWNIEN
jgi:FtsP/CotA-like multicopper oxidase with cupredoxin domain